MWDFLSNVLHEGGWVALLFAITGVVYSVAVRELWKACKARDCTIQALQEKRVTEAQTTSDRIIDYTRELDGAIDRLTATVDALVTLQRRNSR